MEVIHEEIHQELSLSQLVNQNGHYQPNQFGQRQDFLTRISLVCATLGATVVILPGIAFSTGIIEGVALLIIVGCLMWVTSYLNWDCCAQGNETTMPDVIKRELGSRWSILYDHLHCILLILATLVHFTLTAEFFYPLSQFLLGTDFTALRTELVLKSYSYLWVGIILSVFLGISLQISKLRLIVIVARVKLFSISLLCVLLLSKMNNYYPLPDIFAQNNTQSVSFFQLVGVLIISFQPHQLSVNILRNGQADNPKKNLSISFIISICMQLLITILGELQIIIAPKQLQGQTILEYFEINDVLAVLTRLSFFLSTSCTTVLLAHAFREKLIWILRPSQIAAVPAKKSFVFLVSVAIIGGCLGIQILDIQLLHIVSLAGYLCCAPIGILIPICMILTIKPHMVPQQIMTEQDFKATWGSPVLQSNNDREPIQGITASTSIDPEGKTAFQYENNSSTQQNTRLPSNFQIQIPIQQFAKRQQQQQQSSLSKFSRNSQRKSADEDIHFVHPGTYQSSKNL